MQIFSRPLLIFAILCFLATFFLIYQRNTPRRLAFDVENTVERVENELYPTRITIDSLGIELPVAQSSIVDGKFQTTSKAVSFLTSSSAPGKGNSVIYGHNWTSLFGDLVLAKPGMDITVSLNTGETKKYVVTSTAVVTPSQTEILDETEDSRLTIYTCTGFLDSKRFVTVAREV